MMQLLPRHSSSVPILISIPQWCDCCRRLGACPLVRTYVSIPQWCDCCRTNGHTCQAEGLFQSHNGAIAASASLGSLSQGVEFQSHNGAIAAGVGMRCQLGRTPVSIPQWCDCCQSLSEDFRQNLRVSIPQWCDCCQNRPKLSAFRILCFNPTMVRLLL